MRIALIGPPGAGKGTQARMLESRLGAVQIASGDLLREAVRGKTELGLEAKRYMDRGVLAPDDLVLKIIGRKIAEVDGKRGFILDGFPRTVAQAEALGKMLELEHPGDGLDKVLAIIVPDGEIIKRISGRRTCRNCGAMYHVVFDPPRNVGICNACNGELYQREDDAEDTVRMRLEVYESATRPLLEYYERQGTLARIDGVGRPEQIEQRILDVLAIPADAGNDQSARLK